MQSESDVSTRPRDPVAEAGHSIPIAVQPERPGTDGEKGSSMTPDGEEATEEELQNLRHVPDRIPLTVWLVAIISLTERFTYYGINSPFQNYVQNALDDPLRRGGLGLGQTLATNLNDLFQFIVYGSPLAWGIVADTWLGRYRTICVATAVYLAGTLILFATSTPYALHHGAGLGGFVTAILTAGAGLGGLKACVPPFMADQYTETKARVSTTKKKERVVVDRSLTLQSIYSLWYWCVNLGSLSGIATTWMEIKIGFWAAYLLPFCFLWLAVIVLLVGRRRFVKQSPTGSILTSASKAFSYATREGFKMDAAKPEHQRNKHGREVAWTESFIDELKRGLVACRVFQINTNLVSQAAQMETRGIPNDILQNLSALTVIMLMPVVQQLLYPGLRRFGIPFPPISRITAGFSLEAAAMAYAAVLQKVIYSAGPCYDMPLKCASLAGATTPNHVNVAFQVPVYVLDGMAGIFYYPTGQEYAYTKAPSSMRSLVQSVFMLTVAIGAALAFSLTPAYKDPKNVILYTCLAGIMLAATCLFLFFFKKYDKMEDELNELGAEEAPLNGSGSTGSRTGFEEREGAGSGSLTLRRSNG